MGERSEKDGNFHREGGRGFGTIPALEGLAHPDWWKSSQRAHCAQGARRIRDATSKIKWERDLACRWSFGPSAGRCGIAKDGKGVCCQLRQPSQPGQSRSGGAVTFVGAAISVDEYHKAQAKTSLLTV